MLSTHRQITFTHILHLMQWSICGWLQLRLPSVFRCHGPHLFLRSKVSEARSQRESHLMQKHERSSLSGWAPRREREQSFPEVSTGERGARLCSMRLFGDDLTPCLQYTEKNNRILCHTQPAMAAHKEQCTGRVYYLADQQWCLKLQWVCQSFISVWP